MIDLAKLQPIIIQFVIDSLDQFVKQNPDVRASCIGIYCQGYYGSLTAHVDTISNSEAKLKVSDEWLNNPAMLSGSKKVLGLTKHKKWLEVMNDRGRDSEGRFNTACNDFAYNVGGLLIPDWPEPHTEPDNEEEETDRWHFRWPDGSITEADLSEGDAGIDLVVFKFLVDCLTSMELPHFNTESIFRIGVEMHEDTYVAFWIPKHLRPTDYQAYTYNYKILGF